MTTEKVYSTNNSLNSILFIVVFTVGLLLFHNSYDSPVADRCTVVSGATTGCDEAIITAAAEFQPLNICLPGQRISFISATNNLLAENRKTDLLLSQMEKTNYTGVVIPLMFFGLHLFPSEDDDIPPLS